ncbi:MAG: hypothetical protein AAB675_00430 [Patescibacteria group bacterium]
MRNWSTDIKKLSEYPKKHQVFVLESLINFGTQGKKISKAVLKKQLPQLSIDLKKKRYLKMLVS